MGSSWAQKRPTAPIPESLAPSGTRPRAATATASRRAPALPLPTDCTSSMTSRFPSFSAPGTVARSDASSMRTARPALSRGPQCPAAASAGSHGTPEKKGVVMPFTKIACSPTDAMVAVEGENIRSVTVGGQCPTTRAVRQLAAGRMTRPAEFADVGRARARPASSPRLPPRARRRRRHPNSQHRRRQIAWSLGHQTPHPHHAGGRAGRSSGRSHIPTKPQFRHHGDGIVPAPSTGGLLSWQKFARHCFALKLPDGIVPRSYWWVTYRKYPTASGILIEEET